MKPNKKDSQRGKQCLRLYIGSDDPRWDHACRTITNHGYVMLSLYDRTTGHNHFRMEHVVIWERMEGRSVPNGYQIHHLNGDRQDNRPENLLCLPQIIHIEMHRELERIDPRLSNISRLLEGWRILQHYQMRAEHYQEMRSLMAEGGWDELDVA